jgi:hypothetical protein
VPPGAPAAAPGGGLIGVGIAGAALQTLAVGVTFLSPGGAALGLHATADLLLLLGALGLLRRRQSMLWLLCAIGFGVSLFLSGVLRALSAFGPGAGVSLLYSLLGLADGAIYALLGLTLLIRCHDGHPGLGIAAGVLAFARAGASAALAAMPLLSFLGPDLMRSTMYGWRLSAAALGVLLAVFFGTALGRRR